MLTTIEGTGAAAGLRFGIIRSRFNEGVTKRLLDGALDALRKGGASDDSIEVVVVPGAFEIPLVAARLARTRRYDALLCLGAVIRGETPHFEYISTAVSQGIARIAYDYGLPVVFGVLTTDTEAQADARSGAGGCNRGYEAGMAAIEMASLMKRLDSIPPIGAYGHTPLPKRMGSKASPRKRTR